MLGARSAQPMRRAALSGSCTTRETACGPARSALVTSTGPLAPVASEVKSGQISLASAKGWVVSKRKCAPPIWSAQARSCTWTAEWWALGLVPVTVSEVEVLPRLRTRTASPVRSG